MPAQPKFKHRMIRIPDDMWQAVKDCAAANDLSASAVTRDMLWQYIERCRVNKQITAKQFELAHADYVDSQTHI